MARTRLTLNVQMICILIGIKVAFFSVLWQSALHVCELMFSLSLFRGLSSHLLFSFLQRPHGGALLLILFYSVSLFIFFAPPSSFFLRFCSVVLFLFSQCGVPGWVLWSCRAVCKYDTSCLLSSLSVSFLLSSLSALLRANCSSTEP